MSESQAGELEDIKERLQQVEASLWPIVALFSEKPVSALYVTPVPGGPGPGPLDGPSEALLTPPQRMMYNFYLHLLDFMETYQRTLPGQWMVKTEQGELGIYNAFLTRVGTGPVQIIPEISPVFQIIGKTTP